VIGLFSNLRQAHPDLAAVLRECRRGFASVAVFSAMVNVLMLAGPLYMMQIYDRVLTSHSVPTLVALSVLLVAAYSFQGAFEVLRSRLTARIASLLDVRLGVTLYEAVIRLTNRNFGAAQAHQPIRDLDQIRTFLTSSAPVALVDLPWMPVFLAICFLIHPLLGGTALAGAIALTALTILTERRSRASMLELTQAAVHERQPARSFVAAARPLPPWE
jgi:ATP-binding cassette, subfamily C, type I secretion system permease/ATPase